MSACKFASYPGLGEHNAATLHYSQAVRVGDNLETSGQGGWDPEANPDSMTVPDDLDAQIDQAFKNCDLALRTAGGKGFEQVYRINSYHVPLDEPALDAMVRNFRKWMPNHKPIWTCVGVTSLADPGMKVEIGVVAYDPK